MSQITLTVFVGYKWDDPIIPQDIVNILTRTIKDLTFDPDVRGGCAIGTSVIDDSLNSVEKDDLCVFLIGENYGETVRNEIYHARDKIIKPIIILLKTENRDPKWDEIITDIQSYVIYREEIEPKDLKNVLKNSIQTTIASYLLEFRRLMEKPLTESFQRYLERHK